MLLLYPQGGSSEKILGVLYKQNQDFDGSIWKFTFALQKTFLSPVGFGKKPCR